MKYGSICSGIEAATVAWQGLGFKPAWFSEIEPFPCAVLQHHYPDIANLGDMRLLPDKINSGEVEAPDILCGGTPCQAFSVAGLRNSLDDARGNLTLTFCEIADAIDSKRKSSKLQPSIIFWENVPGVLSTKDNAFGCFISELAGTDSTLISPTGRWSNAGCVFGKKRTVAWRVLDAQYFGVAQRRKRVFVVASSRKDFSAAEVLLEFKGLRRDTAPSREAGKRVAPSVTTGAPFSRTGNDRVETEAMVTTEKLRTFACAGIGAYSDDSVAATLLKSGQDLGNGCEAIITMAHGQAGAEIGFDCAPTLTCNHEAPIAAYSELFALAENAIGRQPHNGGNGDGFTEGGPMYTLNATGVHGVAHPIPIDMRNAGRDHEKYDAMNRQGVGVGEAGDPAYTVTSTFVNAIAFEPLPFDTTQITSPLNGNNPKFGDPCHPLAAQAHVPTIAFHPTQDPISSDDGTTHAMGCGSSGGQASIAVAHHMAVRRLTAVECERLQGFPDGYTAIPWRNKAAADCPDGPRYKALGNSWATPVVRWIGERIAESLK